MPTRWDKIAAIGSLLSGIAIVFLAYQIYQTGQSLDYQKQALSDTEKEQSQHLRPWVGVTTESLDGIYFPNNTLFLTANKFEAEKNKTNIVNLLEDTVKYDISTKNFGSTTAENVTFRYNLTNDTLATVNDLQPLSQIIDRNSLLPGDTLDYSLDLPFMIYDEVINKERNDMNYIFQIDYYFQGGNGSYQEIGHIHDDQLKIYNNTAR